MRGEQADYEEDWFREVFVWDCFSSRSGMCLSFFQAVAYCIITFSAAKLQKNDVGKVRNLTIHTFLNVNFNTSGQLNECPLVGFELVNCGLLFLHASDHGSAVTGGFPCHDIMFIAIRATAEFCSLIRIGTDVYHNDVPARRTSERQVGFNSPCCKSKGYYAEQSGKRD